MKETDSELTFREMMSKSKLEVPFPEFEDKVMGLIKRKLSRKLSINRDIKLSWLFFILGSAIGIIVTSLLTSIQQPVLGMDKAILTMTFLIVFSFLLLSHLDCLIDFYKRHKKLNETLTRMV
jgi:hypothetical protein